MIKKFSPFLMVLVMLLVASLACSLGGKKDILLGETYQSDVGGFSLQKVPDYEFEEIWGMVIMAPADADQDIGPFIMAYGGLIEENISSQEIMAEMQSQAEDAEFEDAKKTTIDGVDGLLVDFSGEEAGQALKGKMFVAAPFPNQEFYITALAPESRWKELEPIYDAVLNSVKFVEAQPFEFGLDDWDWEEPLEEPLTEPEEAWEEPTLSVPADGAYLGDVYYHEAGFSMRKIVGYDFSDDFGIITMAKPGLESHAGPLIYVGLEGIEGPLTNEAMFAMVQEDPYEANKNYHTPMPYVLDGVQGLLADFDGTEEGEAIQGRVFFAMLTPYEHFSVYAVAPAGEWAEISPMFEALLTSVDLSGVTVETIEIPTDPGEAIRQWAVYAEASSEFTSTDWSAMQATGAPDVPVCRDDSRAWASADPDTKETLFLFYETPVIPTELVIYQSYNPSQVVEIEFIDIDGVSWRLWVGDPEPISACPDVWTHTIELDEVFYTNTVVISVDQSVLGLGWVEIDAVELAGYPLGGTQPTSSTQDERLRVPYSGLMAGPVYQAWLDIIVGQTKEADLDRIMPITKAEYTPEWKPHPDHAKTFTYEMPWQGMIGYVEINTQGLVYNKYFNLYDPTDFALDTVNETIFELIQAKYMGERNVPYADIANDLEAPGFLRSQMLDSGGQVTSLYWWYGTGGRLIIGLFEDGKLLSMTDLTYSGPP